MQAYFELWLWAMKALLKLAGPVFLLGAFALAVYGSVSRIAGHDELLQLNAYEFPVLIGSSEHQRSYVVVPRVFYRPSMIVVIEIGPSRYERIDTVAGFFGYLVAVMAAAWASWRFWLLPRSKAGVVPSA